MLHAVAAFWRSWRSLSRRTGRSLRRRAAPRSPGVAALEARCLLSGNTGLVWDNTAALTVSFAPDGTDVSGQPSDLFATLDSLGERTVWQQTILDAFQEWAVHSNINFGLVADGGQALGTGGATQGDTRFGDIRIAGAALGPDVLAVAIPADGMLAGTWGGDIIFNTAVPITTLGDLRTISLHESGHVLGLGENDNPESPLYSNLRTGATVAPTPADIAELQRLNGVRRSDRNDRGRSNDTLLSATRLRLPDGFTGATPIVAYGDIRSAADVDHFSVPSLAGYTGPRTFELRTAGISLLQGRISVFDSRGTLLATAAASESLQGTLSVTLPETSPTGRYVVRVEGGVVGPRGSGAYTLISRFDDRLTTTEAVIDQVARGHYDELSANQLARLLTSGALRDIGEQDDSRDDEDEECEDNDDHHDSSSDSGQVIELEPNEGFEFAPRYDAWGTLTSRQPARLYRFRAPSADDGPLSVLTISVRGLEEGGLLPRVTLLGSDGQVLPARIVTNGQGVYTIQAVGVEPGGEYLARVEAQTNAEGFDLGSYAFTARFGTREITLDQVASGVLTDEQSTLYYEVDVAETQLYHFALSSGPVPNADQVAVQLTVFDADGREVYRLVGRAGDTRTANSVMLTRGQYTVRVNAVTADGSSLPPLDFQVGGIGISEPIGPVLGDPTGSLPAGSGTGPRRPQVTWTPKVTVAPIIPVTTSKPNPWKNLSTTQPVFSWYWASGIPLP